MIVVMFLGPPVSIGICAQADFFLWFTDEAVNSFINAIMNKHYPYRNPTGGNK